jgi:hypothetical protein
MSSAMCYKEKETVLAELKSVTNLGEINLYPFGFVLDRCGIEVLNTRRVLDLRTYISCKWHDDYLNIAKLKWFCIENGIKCKSKWKRIDYIQALMKV